MDGHRGSRAGQIKTIYVGMSQQLSQNHPWRSEGSENFGVLRGIFTRKTNMGRPTELEPILAAEAKSRINADLVDC